MLRLIIADDETDTEKALPKSFHGLTMAYSSPVWRLQAALPTI